MKPAADAKRIALDIDFDPFAGAVMADTTRLQQVFWNLVTNAVKFTPADGRVAVSLRRTATNVEIGVNDSGRGISPSFLPVLYSNRFARAKAASIARMVASAWDLRSPNSWSSCTVEP